MVTPEPQTETSESLSLKLNQYPAFKDLLSVAKLSQPSVVSTEEEKLESVILTTRTASGSLGGTELRLQILIEAKEETITIICDYKEKAQGLYSVIFEYVGIKTTVEDSYGLFHPAQRHRIPSYVTLKSLSIESGDLLVFKHILATPKKKRSKASYMGLLPVKRKGNKPGVGQWIRETLSDNPEFRLSANAQSGVRSTSTPTQPLEEGFKPESYVVELPTLQKFIRWMKAKKGLLIFFVVIHFLTVL